MRTPFIVRRIPFTLLLLSLLLLTSTLATGAPVQAASFTVGCDPNPVARAAELIARINDANASADDDSITLTAACIYTLSAVDNDSADGPNGLPVILDEPTVGELTINGNGAIIERSSAAGTPPFRIFYATSGSRLTLDNLTIRNGSAENGGGLLVNEAAVTLNNGTFSGNAANTSGGGIASFNGSIVTVSNSTFSGNSTNDTGGAIYTSDPGSTVTVTDSTFSSNSAKIDGGAIASGYQLGTVSVTGSTFTNNSADNYGGALYNGTGGVLTVLDSTFTGNSADSEGGALANSGTSATLTNTIITGNTAYYGSGIANAGDTTLTVIGSTFSGNGGTTDATSYGGAIWNYIDGTVIVQDSIFFGNSVVQLGGAIISDGAKSTTLINSTLANNSAESGGAIENTNGSRLTLTNTTLSGNTATNVAGGILTFDNGAAAAQVISTPAIIPPTPANRDATAQQVAASSITLNNSIVANNTGGDCSNTGGVVTANFSLVEDGSCGVADGVGGNRSGVDPALGALANYGGTTQTFILLAGSPALNAGSSALALDANGDPLTNDQRGAGFARIVGSAVDMGAFEAGTITIQAVKTALDVNGGNLIPGNVLQYQIIVNNSGTMAASGVVFTDAVPANTTYVRNSTTLNGTPVDDIGGNMPFATGEAVNSPGAPSGQLNVGAPATIVFSVTINQPLPNNVTQVSNQGRISGSGFDPVLTDDGRGRGATVSPVNTGRKG